MLTRWVSRGGPTGAAPPLQSKTAHHSLSDARRRQPISPCSSNRTSTDWAARLRSRSLQEVADTGRKSVGAPFELTALEGGMTAMEVLLPGPPGFVIDLHAMKASDWATVLLDPSAVGERIVRLKAHFPGMNISHVIARRPFLLLRKTEEIDKDATAVKKMLANAKAPDQLLQAVPELLSPKFLLSCLVTIQKWHRGSGREPLDILEADPELIYRAQTMDVPLEPVYEDADGNYQAPEFNYAETRTDWQKHIDDTRYGGTPGPVIVHTYREPGGAALPGTQADAGPPGNMATSL